VRGEGRKGEGKEGEEGRKGGLKRGGEQWALYTWGGNMGERWRGGGEDNEGFCGAEGDFVGC